MNENPDLNLTLTLQEINQVLMTLQELPAKLCNPLTKKITDQANVQITAMQQAEAAKEVPKAVETKPKAK